MKDPALQLLREPITRTFTSHRSPAAVIAALEAALHDSSTDDPPIGGRIDGSTFGIGARRQWRGATYPGVIDGSVESADGGSRITYTIGATPFLRLVLGLWAAMSILLTAFSAAWVVQVLVTGRYGSTPGALFPLAVVVAVWWNWRRAGSRGAALESWLRRTAGADSELTGVACRAAERGDAPGRALS